MPVLGVFLFCGCEKQPDLSGLDDNFTVYTQYDSQADFETPATYYLPDSILTLGEDFEIHYWKDDNAALFLEQIEQEMNARHYTRVCSREEAQLGLQTGYVETTTFLTGYWWDASYWGPYWGEWYYPYPVAYNYNTGTLIMEMVDLCSKDSRNGSGKLPVIWRAICSGLLFYNERYNVDLVLEGIGQSYCC